MAVMERRMKIAESVNKPDQTIHKVASLCSFMFFFFFSSARAAASIGAYGIFTALFTLHHPPLLRLVSLVSGGEGTNETEPYQ